MGRRRRNTPLDAYLNDRRVGRLTRESGGAITFRYDDAWLGWEHALPISLSLPLREDAYTGAPVAAVFENLLPDSEALRRLVAARVGAEAADAHALLAAIGRDCVGALRFVGEGDGPLEGETSIDGEPVDEHEIEALLRGLSQAPLGLGPDEAFRISVAGAQEKTALLRFDGRWLKPKGATPTTHILKPAIGRLPGGIDLSLSVENEFYCLALARACGLAAATADMWTFGETKALVVERFDRRWTRDGRLLRIPQEDLCQALGVPPSRKYQSDGGPGMVDLLRLLAGSDTPLEDQRTLLRAQLLFWLIGATDGHAKNFSIFIASGGGFRLTPLYDVLTAQPGLEARRIEPKQMRLAMSVGRSRHYRFARIHGRHFIETAAEAGIAESVARGIVADFAETVPAALARVATDLPPGFPEEIHTAVARGVDERLRSLRSA